MKNLSTFGSRCRPILAPVLGLLLLMSCRLFSPADLGRGGLPNICAQTLGGRQLWSDVAWSDDWRVQRNVWSRHYRLLDPSNTRRAWGSESYCMSLLPKTETEELIVLLHGLGRTRRSFNVMKKYLEAEGRQVAALSYASTRGTLEQHAQALESVLNRMHGLKRVSFVTHSLGGRVVLRLLEREGAWMQGVQVASVIQLAPPNQGSSIAEQTGKLPLVGFVLGPSFWEVAKPGDEVAPEGCAFGVIAGVRGTDCGWNPWLAEDDDGVVGLAETRASFGSPAPLVGDHRA